MNFYFKIAKILKTVNERKTSVKNAIYNQADANTEKNFKKIYKLVIEVIKNRTLLEDIIEKFFFDLEIKNRECFTVLLYERLLSDKAKKIGGKLTKAVKAKEAEILKYLADKNFVKSKNDTEQDRIMHVRVNGQVEKPQHEKIYRVLEKLGTRDEFVEGLFAIDKKECGEGIVQIFELVKENRVLIQSKSSALPAYLLSLISKDRGLKFDVIDTCSAPGNKTLQLAEYFKESTIFAFEKDSRRYNLLCNNVARCNQYKNIRPFNQDFLTVDPNDQMFAMVKLILCDPSCSGSGTFNNSLSDFNNCADDTIMNQCSLSLAGAEREKDEMKRLIKLAKFQKNIIDHSLMFPKVELLSYSTCSIFITENEFVAKKCLIDNPGFGLLDLHSLVKDKIPAHKGATEDCKETLRICRKCHGLDGFFVAVLEKKV